MPVLTINTPLKVIVNVPRGKQYISEEKPQEQKAQKGGTCWYYVFNKLRLRLGGKKYFERQLPLIRKALDELKEKKGEEKKIAEYQSFVAELEQMRKVEKTVSAYRRIQATHDEPRYAGEYLVEKIAAIYGSEKCTTKNIDRLLNIILDANDKGIISDDFFQQTNLFIRDFGKQDKVATLDEYVQLVLKQNDERYLREIQQTLTTLGCDEQKLLSEQLLREKISQDAFSKMSIRDQYAHYQKALLAGVIQQYGLLTSSWSPLYGIDDLIRALKTEGALGFGGFYGGGYYEKKAVLSEKDKIPGAPYQVHFWPPGSYDEKKETCLHEVLVIGAEKLAKPTSDGNTGYVYFMDPNDASKPDKDQKIYKISYKRFIASLRNVYDQGFTNQTHPGASIILHGLKPFAVCANEKKQKEITEKYHNMLTCLNIEKQEKSAAKRRSCCI